MKDKDSFDVTLCAHELLMRPWQTADAQWYVESRDEEVFRWTKEKRELTIEEAEDGIRHANSTPDAVCFAIVDNKSLELLGNIALAFRANNRKSAEIMYWLVPWGRGRGMATNVVKLLCQWAFDALGLERVTLTTLVGNTRSQLVAERTGFQRQATDKSEGGTDADYLWFELTKN